MNEVNTAIEKAEQIFKETKNLFSQKRKAILHILLETNHPLSAYEITERYQNKTYGKIAPMSVYRIMDLFITLNLVHKINSLNKFIACAHIQCQHAHDLVLLICQKCSSITESHFKQNNADDVSDQIIPKGFKLSTTPWEIQGICSACQDEIS